MEALPQGGQYDARFTEKPLEKVTSGTYFERGDILVSKITPSFENGKQALVRSLSSPFGYATTEVIPIRPKEKRRDARFLFFYLLHPDVRSFVAEKMEGATGRQRVPDRVLLDLPVPDVSSEDETDIANVLEVVQTAISIETSAEALSRQLKQATMRELFTRGLRGEIQKALEFGSVPESWGVAPLNSVAAIQTGAAKGRRFVDMDLVDVPYLRVANVQDGHLDLTEMKMLRIRRAELERYRLREGDVVLTEGGDFDKLGRGFIWRAELPLCIHQNHVFAVRCDRTILCPEFFAYLAQSSYGKAYFLQVAHKTTNLACINSNKLKAFPVVLPTLEEQREIVELIQTIDQKIDIHEKKRLVLENLFKSLLHNLMTGEIHVSALDVSALRQAASAQVLA